MNFLSSRSLSPHNAFGARLTLVNYPPGGRPSGASEMPPGGRRTKVGSIVRECYNVNGRNYPAQVGGGRWRVLSFNPDGSIQATTNSRPTGSYRGMLIKSWILA